jgi:tripartite-type tricarboxylate transporter receptor subunit TctC
MKISPAIRLVLSTALALASPLLLAQQCPEKNITYWQGFPPGGEADQSARHQQLVLKRKCPGIETIVQYKPGASGGLMWAQMNGLPGDGYNIVGITLPHIVLQPMEGQVQYKTEDITPIYWFRYMPDAVVVPEQSAIKTFQDLLRLAKEQPGKLTLAGSGTNSANHAAHERLNLITGIHTIYVPYKGTGDLVPAVIGGQVTGAMAYSAFAVANKGRVRALAVAMEKRSPQLPDVPTFRELGIEWVDGGYGGIGVPKSTPLEARRRLSEMWGVLNNDPEMKDLATKAGFDLIDINIDKVDQFMKDRMQAYIPVAKRMGLIK